MTMFARINHYLIFFLINTTAAVFSNDRQLDVIEFEGKNKQGNHPVNPRALRIGTRQLNFLSIFAMVDSRQHKSPEAEVGFQKCSPCTAFSVQSGTIRIGRLALLVAPDLL
uniref:Uncharacterized protein n=1 Tax=Glossina brevipalpis TaxID=37001 RepID=A0A1A9W6D8_9MUSC